MLAKELITQISKLKPDAQTDIEFLILDQDAGLYDFLKVKDILRNVDCSGINSIGIVLELSHRLDMKA